VTENSSNPMRSWDQLAAASLANRDVYEASRADECSLADRPIDGANVPNQFTILTIIQ